MNKVSLSFHSRGPNSYDDDTLHLAITVSLEEPKIVFEDAGTVDICVIIQNDEEGRPCSREKDFDITFFTVFNSAGEICCDSQFHVVYGVVFQMGKTLRL